MIKREATQRAIRMLGIPSVVVSPFHTVKKDKSGGFSVHLKIKTGIDLEELNKFAGKMAVALKKDKVRFEKVRNNLILMTVTQPLGSTLPVFEVPQNESLVPRKLDEVDIGTDASGNKVFIEIFSKSGGRATLIGGNPNQGKSSLIKIIVSKLAETSTAIIWFDPKFGADASQFKDRVDVYDNPAAPENYLEALQQLKLVVEERNRFIGNGWDISVLPRILLIIDEWAVLSGLGEKPIQAEINKLVRFLAATSRSANVAILLATQRPTKENIDVTTRELSHNRIAFQVGDIHASEAILGASGAERSANILKQGQCVFWLNGLLTLLSLYDTSQGLEKYCSTYKGLKLSVDDLIELNQIYESDFLRG